MEKRLVGNTTRNSDTAGCRESKKGSKEEEKESNLFLPLYSLSFLSLSSSLSIYLCLSIYLSLSFYPVYTAREKMEEREQGDVSKHRTPEVDDAPDAAAAK